LSTTARLQLGSPRQILQGQSYLPRTEALENRVSLCITAAFLSPKPPSTKLFILYGELAGNRTQDPRLKRALLYQLSYELSPFVINDIRRWILAAQIGTKMYRFCTALFAHFLVLPLASYDRGFELAFETSGSEVGAAGGHGGRLVPHQFLHCLQVNTLDDQSVCEGVPAIPEPGIVAKGVPANIVRTPSSTGFMARTCSLRHEKYECVAVSKDSVRVFGAVLE
jgi:hypothetical protein